MCGIGPVGAVGIWHVSRYRLHSPRVILSFRHKGLAELFSTGSVRGIDAQHAARLRILLAALDAASHPRDLDAPGWRAHPLQGAERGTYSLKVSGAWRLTFGWKGKDVIDVDYCQYH